MRSLKVLILEDNPFQLMALHQMLNANDVFDVLTAESVEAACLSLENRGAVDIAICDLQLADSDGLELIRYLAEKNAAQAVIVLSSAEQNVIDGAVSLARQCGLQVLGGISKPASVICLGELLATYQGARETADECSLPLPQVNEFPSTQTLRADGAAILLDDCMVHFQPFLHPLGQLAGVKAVPHWLHPENGLLMPDEFLPIVEYSGLLEALVWHVFEQALVLSASELQVHGQQLVVMVKTPMSMLDHKDFSERLAGLLERFDVSPECLILEVFDSEERNAGDRIESLLRIRLLGCQLCMGDFGVANSSLQQLLELPFSWLKLAPERISGIASDARKAALLAGALGMAGPVRLKVIAAGIASQDDHDAVTALGPAYQQGPHVSLALSEHELRQWMSVRSPRSSQPMFLEVEEQGSFVGQA